MSNSTHADLTDYVDAHEQSMFDFLATLVNMDSPTEDKGLTDKVGDVLEEKAASLGMECSRDKQTDFADNRICRFKPRSDSQRPRVLLIGHFDTVYATGTTGERPFQIKDGKAFGPGVLDMKGGLTIGLFALQALRESFGEIPLDTTFILNSDEEIGSPRSRDIILEETSRHDLALVLEPGLPGPSLTIGRKGVGIFYVDVDGIEAHAGAEPEQGANSIVEMAHKAVAIQGLQDLAKGTSVTPGVIEGGTKPYVVPGACRLSIDIRVVSPEEQARTIQGLERIVEKSWVPRTQARLRGSFHRSPMQAGPATMEHVERLKQISQSLGFPLNAGTTGGASDGNLTAAAGTPTIDGLGPHGARAHSADEFLEVPSVAAKCKILSVFLASLASEGSR